MFSGDYLHFSHFGTGSVPFWFHFSSTSAPNQVEPKALVLEPKIDLNLNCSNFLVPKYRSCGSFDIFGFKPTLQNSKQSLIFILCNGVE